jgi:hypothetical protein
VTCRMSNGGGSTVWHASRRTVGRFLSERGDLRWPEDATTDSQRAVERMRPLEVEYLSLQICFDAHESAPARLPADAGDARACAVTKCARS